MERERRQMMNENEVISEKSEESREQLLEMGIRRIENILSRCTVLGLVGSARKNRHTAVSNLAGHTTLFTLKILKEGQKF